MRRFCKGKPPDVPPQPALLFCVFPLVPDTPRRPFLRSSFSLLGFSPLCLLLSPSFYGSSSSSHRLTVGLPEPLLGPCLSLLTPLLLESLSSSIAETISVYENCKNLISTLISLLNIKHVSAVVLCSPGSKFRSFKMQHAASLPPLSPNPSLPRFADSELHLQFPRLTTQVFLDTERRAGAGAAVQPVTKSWQYFHC